MLGFTGRGVGVTETECSCIKFSKTILKIKGREGKQRERSEGKAI